MQYLQMLIFKGRLGSILCTLFSKLLGGKEDRNHANESFHYFDLTLTMCNCAIGEILRFNAF